MRFLKNTLVVEFTQNLTRTLTDTKQFTVAILVVYRTVTILLFLQRRFKTKLNGIHISIDIWRHLCICDEWVPYSRFILRRRSQTFDCNIFPAFLPDALPFLVKVDYCGWVSWDFCLLESDFLPKKCCGGYTN